MGEIISSLELEYLGLDAFDSWSQFDIWGEIEKQTNLKGFEVIRQLSAEGIACISQLKKLTCLQLILFNGTRAYNSVNLLYGLTELTKLSIYGSSLTYEIINWIRTLSNLWYLDVSRCVIAYNTYTAPELPYISGITHLKMQECPIEIIWDRSEI